jgi:hypothetical protein
MTSLLATKVKEMLDSGSTYSEVASFIALEGVKEGSTLDLMQAILIAMNEAHNHERADKIVSPEFTFDFTHFDPNDTHVEFTINNGYCIAHAKVLPEPDRSLGIDGGRVVTLCVAFSSKDRSQMKLLPWAHPFLCYDIGIWVVRPVTPTYKDLHTEIVKFLESHK